MPVLSKPRVIFNIAAWELDLIQATMGSDPTVPQEAQARVIAFWFGEAIAAQVAPPVIVCARAFYFDFVPGPQLPRIQRF